MKKTCIALWLGIAITALASCKPYPPDDYNKQKKVQAAVDKVRKALSDTLGISFPSMNVLIETPTEKIFVSSSDGSQPHVTARSRFRFASNTKNFTATAILNMWEDGWLNYKAKIIDLIPESKADAYVPATDDWDFPYKDEITIEQLLQHAAGVFDIDNDTVPGYNGMTYTDFILDIDPNHQFNRTEMVKVLKEKNLFYFTPGTAHHYSNTGYAILAEIIERVYSFQAGSQKTYADYMEDYLIGTGTPVPLPTVHFPVLATDNSMPDPHIISTILLPNSVERIDKFNMSAQVGEGNGYGSMDDLNTRIRTLMKGQNVLKPATVALMQHSLSPGSTSYALGCTFTKNLGYGHNGARIGYLSLMAYDPQYDVSVVSMISLWDLREGGASFFKCFTSIYDAAYAAREALSFPGKP